MKTVPLHWLALPSLLTIGALALAGPLDPPAGPVGPTYKTLTEVEPRTPLSQATTPGEVANQFKITQPGSYYLAGNMTASTGSAPCILIAASEVTLDLSGFSVRNGATEGIRISGNNVTVRNGSVVISGAASVGVVVSPGMGDAQLIGLTVSSLNQCVFTNGGVRSITLRDCTLVGGEFGVLLGDVGTIATLRQVDCHGQSKNGLFLGIQALVEDCVVRNVGNATSTGASIRVSINGIVRRTTILDATSGVGGDVGPSRAIAGTIGLTVEDCTVFSRGTIGIDAYGSACVRKCIIKMASAGNTGIVADYDSFIADNSVNANGGTGIALGSANTATVVRNQIIDATTAISGTSLSLNIIGPVAGPGNPTASTNPHANFVN